LHPVMQCHKNDDKKLERYQGINQGWFNHQAALAGL
jgi:hypothetical protein